MLGRISLANQIILQSVQYVEESLHPMNLDVEPYRVLQMKDVRVGLTLMETDVEHIGE